MYRIRIHNEDGTHQVIEGSYEKLVPAVDVARRLYLSNPKTITEVIDKYGTILSQYPRQIQTT